MSELQNDDVIEEVNNSEVENLDTGADLATASEDQHDKTDQVDEEAKRQKATQEAINKQTFKAKQAERDLQSANDKLKAFQDKDDERAAAAVATLPSLPDQYGDDFEKQMADYTVAVQAQSDHNSGVAAQQREAQHQQEQAQQAEDNRIAKAFVAYDARAVQLGISKDELQAAGSAVVSYGISNELASHILADPDGPLIIKHLAANPIEGLELASMSPFSVGTYLDTVKAKAAALKPKSSNAPDPVDTLQGNGVDPEAGRYQNIKGVKYS